MQKLILFFLLVSFSCLAFDDLPQMKEEDAEWLKDHLQKLKIQFVNANDLKLPQTTKTGKCQGCFTNPLSIAEEPKIFIFMSFSVPDAVWLNLSQELEGLEGVFVLQGLPHNSFKELAANILRLKEKGFNSTIQLHPKLFQEYEIEHVPTFMIEKGNAFDKVSGNISLSFALDLIKRQGELASLADLLQRKEKQHAGL
jgi:conjugal transfer pilus assembly protein TrbC